MVFSARAADGLARKNVLPDGRNEVQAVLLPFQTVFQPFQKAIQAGNANVQGLYLAAQG